MNKEREIQQQKAVDALFNKWNKSSGVFRAMIKATMRFGKSKVVLDFLKKTGVENYYKNVYIIVPKVINVESWKTERNKWFPELKITVLNYKSIFRMENPSFVIFDEIHNFTINQYNKIKNTLKGIDIIAITATLPREQEKKDILKELDLDIVYKINLETSIDLKIVNNFEINVIYSKLSTNLDIRVKTGKYDFTTSETKSYRYLTKAIAKTPTMLKRLNRSRFLYTLKSKTEVTKKLLKLFKKDKKIIIFTKSIDIAKELCENTIHSKNNNNDNILRQFINNDINKISTVNMLNEGVTIPDIDTVIIESFDSNSNNLLQRIGRSLQYKKDKIVKVIIMVTKDTIEEKWLELIIPNVKVTYYNYNYGKFIKKQQNGN